MAIARNRIRNEMGKGIEALRQTHLTISHTVAGALAPVIPVGPFDVDVDIVSAYITFGKLLTDAVGNAIDIFNGTVAGAKVAATNDLHAVLPVLQVPTALTVSAANKRLKAGTVLSVRLTAGGDDSATTGAYAAVTINYEIPISDPNAKVTTYSTYDGGSTD